MLPENIQIVKLRFSCSDTQRESGSIELKCLINSYMKALLLNQLMYLGWFDMERIILAQLNKLT